MIRPRTRVGHMLDGIHQQIAACDTSQLHALKRYAIGLTTTNCPWAHYSLRTFLIDYIDMELDARRLRDKHV